MLKIDICAQYILVMVSPLVTHPRFFPPPPFKSTPFLFIISKTQNKAELLRGSLNLL